MTTVSKLKNKIFGSFIKRKRKDEEGDTGKNYVAINITIKIILFQISMTGVNVSIRRQTEREDKWTFVLCKNNNIY